MRAHEVARARTSSKHASTTRRIAPRLAAPERARPMAQALPDLFDTYWPIFVENGLGVLRAAADRWSARGAHGADEDEAFNPDDVLAAFVYAASDVATPSRAIAADVPLEQACVDAAEHSGWPRFG